LSDVTTINNWFAGELVAVGDMKLPLNALVLNMLWSGNKLNGQIFGIVPTITGSEIFTTSGFAFFGETTDTTYITNTGSTTLAGTVAAQGPITLVSPNSAIYIRSSITTGAGSRTTIVTGTVMNYTGSPVAGDIKICDVVDSVPTNFTNNDINNYFSVVNNTMYLKNPDGSLIKFANTAGNADIYTDNLSTSLMPSVAQVPLLNKFYYTTNSQWTSGQERILAVFRTQYNGLTSGIIGLAMSLVGGGGDLSVTFSIQNTFSNQNGTLTIVGYKSDVSSIANILAFMQKFTFKLYHDNADNYIITIIPTSDIAGSSVNMNFTNAAAGGMYNKGTPYLGQLISAYPYSPADPQNININAVGTYNSSGDMTIPNIINAANFNGGAFNVANRATAQAGIIYPNVPGSAGPYSIELGYDNATGNNRLRYRVDNNNTTVQNLANYTDITNNGVGIVASGESGGNIWWKFKDGLLIQKFSVVVSNGALLNINYPLGGYTVTPSVCVNWISGTGSAEGAQLSFLDFNYVQVVALKYSGTGAGTVAGPGRFVLIAIGETNAS